MAFKDKLEFSRQRLELLYSVVLLFVIPAALVFNTVITVQNARADFDIELRRKADLANEVLSASVKDSLDTPDRLQSVVDNVMQNTEEVSAAKIIRFDSGQYTTVASTDQAEIGQTSNNIQVSLATSQNRSIAALVNQDSGDRAWRVITPIAQDDGVVTGVVSSEVSLSASDKLVSASFQKSLIVLSITLVVVILLLLNHFKFVEYASLFKKLEEVDQMKNDFIQVATHELRAPLTAIKGNMDMALDELPKKAKKSLKAPLTEVVRQIDRLNNLIDDLLNVARLEQNRTNFEIEAVDSTKILQMLVTQFSAKAEAKNIQLELQPTDIPLVMADPSRLEEVFTNLIDNAIKYSRQGSVTIRQDVKKNVVSTHIKDTGIGMSAAERDRLFQRFARIRNEKTQNISGTGLGLWITKQYVEKMKGRIYVDSLEDVGSEFTVELPVANK
ncbi:TPA: HAMP domain-containing histidine kinase [Candidatus Saccharibacteria bacterium]|nr:HAMP domain-containing histidine kinase [Candidatus Saccharibacteria bacterium]HIO87328.1 HAMP domain-containing histidine kinase [Candidatus Saccharibacteria bacterium]